MTVQAVLVFLRANWKLVLSGLLVVLLLLGGGGYWSYLQYVRSDDHDKADPVKKVILPSDRDYRGYDDLP